MIRFDIFFGHRLFKDSFLKDIYFKDIALSKNKNLEIQFSIHSSCIFSLCLGTSFTGESHAGPELSIGLLGLYFGVKLYDSRHWDYSSNRWEENNA